MASDISASDVILQADSGGDLTVLLADTGDSITFENDLSDKWWGVSSALTQIDFGDGSTLAIGQPGYDDGQPLTFTWVGTSDNTTLTGSDYGSNVFDLGPGDDTVTGGSGNNSIEYSGTIGQATVTVSGGSGITNELDFGSALSDEALWFTQVGNDLDINMLGTSGEITIKNWFSSSNNQLQEITAGGLKLDSQVSQLVAAMATYGANNPGFDAATTTQMPTDSNLQAAIAAVWHA